MNTIGLVHGSLFIYLLEISQQLVTAPQKWQYHSYFSLLTNMSMIFGYSCVRPQTYPQPLSLRGREDVGFAVPFCLIGAQRGGGETSLGGLEGTVER